MEKIWLLFITIVIFLVGVFLFWKLTSSGVKKEYGTNMWTHWPTRLSYWQAAILYSIGFTIITICLLKWANMLNF